MDTAWCLADNLNRHGGHNLRIGWEIVDRCYKLDIDVSGPTGHISILVPVHFSWKNTSLVHSRDGIDSYRLTNPVVGRNRATDAVELRTEIIEPS